MSDRMSSFRIFSNRVERDTPSSLAASSIRPPAFASTAREGATLKELAQSYNVGIATISRLSSRVAG